MAFYDAIHTAYPDLTIIASNAGSSCLPPVKPPGIWMDIHNYTDTENLIASFGVFDNWDRNFPVILTEYCRWHVPWPSVMTAVAEAIYMLGFERNSDLVRMTSYAPLFHLIDIPTDWTVCKPPLSKVFILSSIVLKLTNVIK